MSPGGCGRRCGPPTPPRRAARSSEACGQRLGPPSRAEPVSAAGRPRPRPPAPWASLRRVTGRSLPGRREELEGDVVGIAERQPRPVVRVDDPTMGDAELVEPALPALQ